MRSTELPGDTWSLIAEFSGVSAISTLPFVCKNSKNAFKNNSFWKKLCHKHFPYKVFPYQINDENINWLKRFKELEFWKYPGLNRKPLLFRTVKEGNLSSLLELKPTLDELNEKEWKGIESFSLIDWANKLDYQAILNFFYNIACHALAPNKTDSRGYDFIFYLIVCNQSVKLEKLVEVNDCIFANHESLFKACIKADSKDIFSVLISRFPGLPHLIFDGQNTALHYIALRGGHPSLALELLNLGLDVNHKGNGDATPLIMAAQEGHFDLVRLFLERGANVNDVIRNRASALMIAAQNGHYPICELLVENGAEVNQITEEGYSSLYAACQNGHYEIAKLLLDKGANPKQAATECGSCPLGKAAWEGYNEIVEILLDKKADINQTRKDGITALYMAAQEHQVKTVELLIAAGADINIKSEKHALPVQVTAQKGYLDIIEMLEKRGTDLNHRCSEGFTAFILAAQEGHLHAIQYLFARNAAINHVVKNGASALFAAAQNGHTDVVKFLLANGADPKICKKDGTSPLNIALLNGHNNIAALIRAALNKPGLESKAMENKTDTFHILISAQQQNDSPLIEFKKLERNSITPIFFDSKGNEVTHDEKKTAHILLQNCNGPNFKNILATETSLKYRYVQQNEITIVKSFFRCSAKFKIKLSTILAREAVDLRVEKSPSIRIRI